MGTNETLKKAIRTELITDSLTNAAETSFSNKFGSRLKRIVLITSLAGAALLFKGCASGYVASEPSYMHYDRPPQPNNLSVWIDGDWYWNNQSQQYYHQNGYWDNPRQGKTYVSGHWYSTSKGKSWSKGHWQSEGSNKNHHHHNQDSY
jgi:hypothetical protein